MAKALKSGVQNGRLSAWTSIFFSQGAEIQLESFSGLAFQTPRPEAPVFWKT